MERKSSLFNKTLSMQAYLQIVHEKEKREESFDFKEYNYNKYIYKNGLPHQYNNDQLYHTRIANIKQDYRNQKLNTCSNGNIIFITMLKYYDLLLIPEFIIDISLERYLPNRAPEPNIKSKYAYLYPSYIIWDWDDSFTSFFGFPNYMDMPKNVLRKTRGHFSENSIQNPNTGLGFSFKRNLFSMSFVDGRDKWEW